VCSYSCGVDTLHLHSTSARLLLAELGWTSGTVVTEEERQAAANAAAAIANKEQAYLDGLRNDERLPVRRLSLACLLACLLASAVAFKHFLRISRQLSRSKRWSVAVRK
jgi:hypothetical protein